MRAASEEFICWPKSAFSFPMSSDIETFTVSPRVFFESSATFTFPNWMSVGAMVDVVLRRIEGFTGGRRLLGLEILQQIGDRRRRGDLRRAADCPRA